MTHSTDIRCFHHVHREDGYLVDHYKQRQLCTIQHVFILTDLGADELPTGRQLLEQYVEKPLEHRGYYTIEILKHEAQLITNHRICHTFVVKCKHKCKERRHLENSYVQL